MEKYKIKLNKKDELLQGRTITYISQICGMNRVIVSYALNGYEKRKLTYTQAEKIIKGISKDSIKINQMVLNKGLHNVVEYFFEKID